MHKTLIGLIVAALAAGLGCAQSEPSTQTEPTPAASMPVPAPTPTPAPTQSGLPAPTATREPMQPGPSTPEPAPIMHAVINPATLYPESLDQMIMRTDFIVRATLVSATATTEAVSSREGASTTYRPVHRLRFTVHEYLKGSGSSENPDGRAAHSTTGYVPGSGGCAQGSRPAAVPEEHDVGR